MKYENYDHGKRYRAQFLEESLQEKKWDRIATWLLVATVIYFGCHIGYALADTIIINQPNGGQTVCIMQNGVVTCF